MIWYTDNGEDAKKALSTIWTDDAALTKNAQKALAAATRIAKAAGFTMDELEEMGIGDNAAFIRLAAAAADMLKAEEPPAVTPERSASATEPVKPGQHVEPPAWVKTAMLSEAARDEKHPDHARVRGEIRQWFEQTYGSGAAGAADDASVPVGGVASPASAPAAE